MDNLGPSDFIPSLQEQAVLRSELVYLFASAVIRSIPGIKDALENIYPDHLTHPYSAYAGIKTEQV
jgi:hypothetical protein